MITRLQSLQHAMIQIRQCGDANASRARRVGQTMVMMAALSVGGALLLSTTPAQAQTRFEWRSSVNLVEARPIDRCIVAYKRITDSTKAFLPARDTMPWVPGEGLTDPPLATAVQAAQQCSKAITPDKVVTRDMLTAIYLFTVADRQGDAQTLIARRRSEIPAADTAQRAYITDSIVQVLMQVRPVPFKMIEALIDTIAGMKNALPWSRRGTLYNWMLKYARDCNDSTLGRRMATLLVQLPGEMSDADRSDGGFFASLPILWQADSYLNALEARDSLRKSTEAYVALMRSRWAMLKTGGAPLMKQLNPTATPEKWTLPIGFEAPPVQADWWFPQQPTTPRPTHGKIALVTFLTSKCHNNLWCQNVEAVLRRISQRFPDLEITLVAEGTLGYIGNTVVEPEQEAKLQSKWWQDFQKIPSVLAVQKSPYWRLTMPDGRRIDQDNENQKNYGWNGFKSPHIESQLIDENGILVLTHDTMRHSEQELIDYIHILMQRQKSRQRTGQ